MSLFNTLTFFFPFSINQEKLNNIARALKIPFSLPSKGLEATTKAFYKCHLLYFKHLLNFKRVLNIWIYIYSTTKANYNVHSKFVFPCYDLAVEPYDKTRGS